MSFLFLVLSLGIFCVFLVKRRQSRLPLPPGPKPWPIIGNVYDVPSIRPWEKYREWCEHFKSDTVFVHLPMQPTVILGSVKAATDLLEKQSQVFSCRQRFVVLEMMGNTFQLVLMHYTSKWRTHRRVFHQHFSESAILRYLSVQRHYVRGNLPRVLSSPQSARELLRLMVTSIILRVVYAKDITDLEDEYVRSAHLGGQGFSEAMVPGAYWVEFFPFLRHIPSWVPGTSARKLAEKYFPYVYYIRDKPYFEVKAAMEKGVAPSSLAKTMIEDVRTKYGGTADESYWDEIAMNITGQAYGAAVDTTVATCESFMIAMVLFPDVQRKAQAELDRVVGDSRLPDYDDMPNLPYIRAIVMEALRWMPILPFGIPHTSTADSTYKGYHIPKGALCIPNIWAMMHNPEDYPQPEQFKPERFLDPDGNINPDVRDPSTLAFGFGRRICPGRFFGKSTVTLFVASTLHVFNISAGVDASGKPVKLSPEQGGTFISTPDTIPCGLEPRSEAALALIRAVQPEL